MKGQPSELTTKTSKGEVLSHDLSMTSGGSARTGRRGLRQKQLFAQQEKKHGRKVYGDGTFQRTWPPSKAAPEGSWVYWRRHKTVRGGGKQKRLFGH